MKSLQCLELRCIQIKHSIEPSGIGKSCITLPRIAPKGRFTFSDIPKQVRAATDATSLTLNINDVSVDNAPPRRTGVTTCQISACKSPATPRPSTLNPLQTMHQIKRHTFRKLLLTIAMLTVLLHGPSFKALINILVTTHILLHIAFDRLQSLAAQHFPSFTVWLRAYIAARYKELSAALTPVFHHIVRWTTLQATAFISESPRMLCAVNAWIVDFGGWMVQGVPGELGLSLAREWRVAGEDAVRFCEMVRGWADAKGMINV